ncbi:MAG TPA: DNA methyltransferase, partial [bacterium]|nr:DNA methyltransferase [bacterium]
TLYYGDNLEVLRLHVKDESVDLVYLDPPFKSDQNYNVLFAERNGTRSPAQIKAFKDTWTWDLEAAEAFEEVVERGGKVSETMQGFRKLLGDSDMLAYISMMAPRLIELRRVLKSTGSIYLHCDSTAGAYLRLLMDAVFGPQNLQNEIVWYYRGGGVSKRRFGRRHDVILFYSRKPTANRPFNVDAVRTPYSPDTVERLKYKAKAFRGDKVYDSYEPHPEGKHPDDVWLMQPVMPSARERLGYPTQKPEALLERIIKASSNESDLVLDPFCGCGTTIAVAQRLNRRWIGIDITHLAVTLMKYRLEHTFGEGIKQEYEVIGEPVSISGAMQLAKENPYQFQWWALGLLGARPVEEKKGADKGIDGRLYFHDETKGGKTKQIVFSVKSGHVTSYMVRDLRGVVEREGAEIGVFITMLDPTKDMRSEAAGAGFYESTTWQKRYPRIQILTIEDILRGKGIDCPPLKRTNVTFKRAPRAKNDDTDDSNNLFD